MVDISLFDSFGSCFSVGLFVVHYLQSRLHLQLSCQIAVKCTSNVCIAQVEFIPIRGVQFMAHMPTRNRLNHALSGMARG